MSFVSRALRANNIALTAVPSRRLSSSAACWANDAYILSAARTATGKFNGGFKDVPAPVLGSHVVKAALQRSGVPAERVTDLYFGNVLQGGVGQSPARQVVMFSGLPETTEAVTINKVCASGLKAVVFAAQNIQLGLSDVMVAGGMESMSRVPHYLSRNAPPFGHQKLEDGLIKDGLWDVYDQIHMGNCAENTAKKLNISREAQDAYAIESYRRAKAAWERGQFKAEIVPVKVPSRKGEVVVEIDEEYEAVNISKIPTLKPAFQKEGGTVTAANSSTFSDGASALVLGSQDIAQEYGGSKDGVLARIVGYADAATKPIDFPLAPTLAIPLALSRAGLETKDIAKWEINEAFAAVSKAIGQILDLDAEKVNVNGGAIALGHALGSSGSRILTSLLYTLKPGEFGVAAICNGGGGSTAVVVQRIDHV
ncbi:Thiolase, N-terminal domain-containing protein [Tricharina praecox]|uniref:Thiolase, N-terminal domain-containing protein n=1 Tax=Tricharina praecox TaxID=43433 RepID=UPI00221ED788|nr:Thiolase, N-terminal domain-containing protein [Tricharina praecox]KAI5858979.1 Thiolase, N-terminal domain-containing protein [Tricharina praecox]